MNSSTGRVEWPIVQRISYILGVVMAYCLLRPILSSFPIEQLGSRDLGLRSCFFWRGRPPH